MSKTSIAAGLVAIAILGLLVFRNGYQTPGGLPSQQIPPSSIQTVMGVFTCLPHKDASGPQTMECAFGLRTDDGSHYALDWSDSATSSFDLPMDRKFSVTGLFTPVGGATSEHWKIYDVKGVIKVSRYEELKSGIPALPVNASVTMELNKPIIIADTTIKVSSVTQDSRCPSDVVCIQAGKVVVSLYTSSPSGVATTALEPGKTMTTETLSITLDGVTPYPVSTHKTADSEYRFLVKVKSR